MLKQCVLRLQTTPLVAGLAIGAAAYAGRALIQVGSKWQAAGSAVGRSFYKVRPLYCSGSPATSLQSEFAGMRLCQVLARVRVAYVVGLKHILLVLHHMRCTTQAHPCCRAASRQK